MESMDLQPTIQEGRGCKNTFSKRNIKLQEYL